MFEVSVSNNLLKYEYSSVPEGFILTVENTGQMIEDCIIEVSVDLVSLKDGYVLFPGAVYGGNKADRIQGGQYPPRLSGFEITSSKGPVIIGDIPRWKDGITQQTYDLTMPACGIYHDNSHMGMILSTETGPVETPYGFCIKNEKASILFPCKRKERYRHCAVYEKSTDKGILFNEGEKKQFHFNIEKEVYKDRADFSAAMVRRHKKHVTCKYDYSFLLTRVVEKINRDEFDEENGFYMDSCESRRYQSGWVSGLITAYSMLLTDSPLSHERAKSTIRFTVEKGMSPCGLPFGIYDKKGFRGLEPYDADSLDFAGTHVRRIYDAVLYMLRIAGLRKLEPELSETLIETAFTSCHAIYKMIEDNGNCGHCVDLNTGKVLWGGSAAGVAGISCLCLGYDAGGPEKWLKQAEKAGEYYVRFNDMGYFTGGPGDILMAPDSESNYAAMEAFFLLYTFTKNERWKKEFIRASQIMTTWICMSDYPFPTDSSYGKLGVRTRGLVMANAQNKHLGPGVCTASAGLFNPAYQYTGDELFRGLFQMIYDAASEVAKNFNGEIPENINVADSLCNRGEFYKGHGIWTENAYILMSLEKEYE